MRVRSASSRAADIAIYVLVGAMGLVTVYPFWDTLVVSIMPLNEYLASTFHLVAKQPTIETYRYILGMPALWQSYRVTVVVTAVGSVINMVMTTLTAYALSRRDLKGRRVIMALIVFTMMFSGGIIPLYVLVRQLGIMDSIWALILPGAIATYNLIIMRAFFATLPESLEESGRIDGANDFTILLRIMVPISMPAIATISLFYAVGHWNAYINAVMFISDRAKWTLQLYLRAMLYENEAAWSGGAIDDPFLLGQPIKMATVMVSVVPIMLIYPFFQRYFTQGVLLGAVKG